MRSYPDRPFVGAGAVILRDKEVLLVKRGRPPKQDEWSLPGGVQHLGETLAETVRREVREETGLDIVVKGMVDVIELIERDDAGEVRHHYSLVDYWGRPADGRAPQAGDDAAEARWFPLDRLAALGLWRETRRIIDMAVALAEKEKQA